MFRWFQRRITRLHPSTMLLLSYLAAIFLGTGLLKLPVSTVTGQIHLIDALFTATSAVCVTGLVVVDTGTYFSPFGQWVILALIQLGGLGIMTISVALFQIVGRKVLFQQRMAMQEVFSHTPREDIYSLLRSVFLFTVVAEIFGAVLLFLYWWPQMPAFTAAYFSLFHAVSAFCNAGFSLFTASFTGAQTDWLPNLALCLLIVLGGIGFPVVHEIFTHLRQRGQKRRTRFSMQTKTVLLSTIILITAGAVVILFLEQHLVASKNWSFRIMTAVFQSITCRTAGFNTVDISALNTATLLFMIFLMFVGASPGSCGGGVKTTTLMVLGAFSWSRLKRYKAVNLFKKTVPSQTVAKSISAMVFSFAAISMAVFLVIIADPSHGTGAMGHRQFLSYLFETVSAFATVGLSMGVTAGLNIFGKLVIVLMMVIGRIGIPAFTYIIAGAEPNRGIEYAEENLMIG